MELQKNWKKKQSKYTFNRAFGRASIPPHLQLANQYLSKGKESERNTEIEHTKNGTARVACLEPITMDLLGRGTSTGDVNSRTWKRLKAYLKNKQWSLSEAAIEHHLENFHKRGHHNPRFGLMWEKEVSCPSSDIRLQPPCPSGRWSEVTSFFLVIMAYYV